MKTQIQCWVKALSFSALLLANTIAVAQVENFNITVQNLTQTASNKLEFDVYLLDTDPNQAFELGSCQLGFLFNSLIYTGGTISVTIDNTDSGLSSAQMFTSNPSVASSLSGYPDQTLIRLSGRTPPGAGNGTIISTSGNGTLLTHFVITSTVDFVSNSTPDIVFCANTVSNPLYPTRVSSYIENVNTGLTVTPGVNALVYGNPPLNPPPPVPTAFNVTGTGSYCEGEPGLEVGLDDSETGVTYTLYRNSIAQLPTVEGTGSAISFGIQLFGTYTVTGTNVSGTTPMTGSAVITENPLPSAPQVGTISHPTCGESTGSVVLTGLPSGNWTLTRNPGSTETGGSGTSTTVLGLPEGTYSFTVTNSDGCTSPPSADVVINPQPPTPTPPVVGTITHPSCEESTGSVVLTGLPSGNWTLTRSPDNVTTDDSGTNTTLSEIPSGTYTYTVTNSDGCTSSPSDDVVIDPQPETPSAPVVGTITQPTCEVATGSVVLSGLPSGTWRLTRSPDNVTTDGSGTSTTLSEIPTGTYTYTVTNAEGCTSASSGIVEIKEQPPSPSAPTHTVDCSLGFGNAVITVTSPTGTGYEYRLNTGAFQTSTIFSGVTNGSYTITVRNSSGCTTTGSNFEVSCGCVNPPTVDLSSTSGSTCSSESVTVSGNTFGGSATSVSITEDGAGSVSPSSSGTSPFSFTYTPAAGDADKEVIITVTTNNPLGAPCTPATATYTLRVNATPAPPVVGTITHPTCDVATGSVVLSGLPSSGTWTLTRTPGAVTTTGTGTSTTVSGIPAGTYTYTVTNAAVCISAPSANVVINAQPPTPSAPLVGTITPPTCNISTGSVVLSGLPSSGSWTLTRTPGGVTYPGTGISTTVSGLVSGTYTFTVTNSDECTSPSSANVVIPEQPPTPAAPVVGTITPPSCEVATGSVVLSGLPSSGGWTLTRYPGGITTTGSGTSTTVSGIPTGTHNFTLTNDEGCTSSLSGNVIIPEQPPTPSVPVVGTITQPGCAVATGSVVLSGLPSSGTWTLTRSPGAVTTLGTGTSTTISGLAAGTYTFTVTNQEGCTSASSANVVINTQPLTPPAPQVGTITHPTCAVATGSVVLSGLPSSGTWTLTRTPGDVTTTGTGTNTTVSGIPAGTYTYAVTNADECISASSANVVINTPPVTPTAPLVGTITPPTCNISTGSVVLSGLPPSGTWTLTRTPGGVTYPGTGTSTTISGLVSGTYTFTVTNADVCTSPSSANVVIPEQPPTPTAPVVGTITPPSCDVATGSVVLSGLPPTGTWILTRYPGGITITGSGTSTTASDIPTGTYNFTVTNYASCTSSLSGNVIIPDQPPTPSAPVVGTITQPGCDVATGSVVLSGLPSSGTWTLTRSPGNVATTGTGTSTTVSGIPAGTYTYTVKNTAGCTSASSANVVINAQPPTPSAPLVGTITHPKCAVATGSVVLSGLPSSGTWTLTRSPGNVTTSGTGTSTTVSGIPAGTYTYTVKNAAGCISASSANVVINAQPASPAAPVHTIDCSLGAGNAVVTVTSPTGTGYEYRLNTGNYQTSNSFTGVDNGNYTITVKNAAGCTTTGNSFSVSCGCVTPPTVSLSSSSGSTCGTNAVTVSGNTFGGSATSVSITENGAGSVSPTSTNTSPFSFTYTPASGDAGKTVIITVTTNNPLGSPCTAASATYTLTVNSIPSAPTVGTRTHPTCTVATGSVVLGGLPSSGTWTLTRNPGGATTSGTGTSTTVSGLAAGTYTFTVSNAEGCTSASSSNVVINAQPPTPTPPVTGTITQPTCAVSTGSVELSGLPSSGNWTVTRTPGGVTKTGTGTTTTVSVIPSGTYTFTITNSYGCISAASDDVVINPQPPTPTAPSAGNITPPTCETATGSVVLMSLPPSGTWTLTRYPGTVKTTGTGTNTTISGLPSATYNYTVTNSYGCVSLPSDNIVIPAQPPTPSAPVVGTITQPTFDVPTGSVVLSGLPTGNWIITRSPDEVTTTGTGSGRTITDLPAGVFTFTVTNSFGCTSTSSAEVIISTPGIPTLIITNPEPVCSPATVDITAPEITTGSTPGLTYTYWTDASATITYNTPAEATTGTYYIKGTTISGFFDIQPVIVTVEPMPVANAGPDQSLEYMFNTSLDAELNENESGIWSVISGTGTFNVDTDPKTTINSLSPGENILQWTVTNSVCPPVSDQLTITVLDLVIPTLITPNMDGRNDYFVIRGIENMGKTEFIVFDRRGLQVYKNLNYNNEWDGVDYNGNPLPEDTYFFVLKSESGISVSSYVVIRR